MMTEQPLETNDEWDEFVREIYADIFRFALHLSGNTAEAADLTQRTFLRAWENRSALRETGRRKAWVYTIARRVFIDERRWWKRLMKYRELLDSEPSTTPQPELAVSIRDAVAALPLRQREVFVLRHWHGFSTREVAELLRLHEGSVKVHLKRAVDAVKHRLAAEDAESHQSLGVMSTNTVQVASLQGKEGIDG